MHNIWIGQNSHGSFKLRQKIPEFFRDFPEERLKELMEDEKPKDFNKAMDKLLYTDKKKNKLYRYKGNKRR